MKKISKYIVMALFAGVFTSCDKLSDFGDTNVNPGATTKPIIGALMTNVQSGLGGYAYQATPGYFCQYFSETQYSSASLYASTQGDFTGAYTGALYDLQNIINRDESKSMSAISKILQQYIYWTLTDRWGDIPYSEALQGEKFTRPKYDSQEEIYKGMIKALKEANAMFDGSLITGDLIYNGNEAAWKRAANSMRALMALQLSKKYPGAGDYAATEFKAALADGVITSNSQNFALSYPGGNFPSPYWSIYNGRKDLAESATLTNIMADLADGRQEVFGGATEQGSDPNATKTSNVGMPYGLIRAKAEAFTAANTNWARVLRGDKRTDNSSVYIITSAQLFLARAEAADYGWTTDNLNDVYEEGIKQSFAQWGVPAPSAAYFTKSTVDLAAAAGTGANLKNIALQRYIATYPDGLQGWNIWRKTGYPVLTPAPDAVNPTKQIPHRYLYGTGEYTSNKESVESAVSRVSGYSQESKLWWE